MILEHILLNPRVWIRLDTQSQTRITQYWSEEIYTNHFDVAISVSSFTELILKLRLYYWFEETDPFAQCVSIRPKDLDVAAVRQGILQTLQIISNKIFTEIEFFTLISNCISCPDIPQIVDFLLLVKLLAISEEKPFERVERMWPAFSVLHHLLNCEDENIIFATLDAMAALQFMQLIPRPKVHQHVLVLIGLTPLSIVTETFCSKIIPLTLKFWDFLPFSFFAVLHSGEKFQNLLMQNLQPDPHFAECSKVWILLPLITALQVGGEFCNFTMKFIARCTIENWQFSLVLIDIVARTLKKKGKDAEIAFLNEVCLSMMEHSPPLTFEYVHSFFDLAIYALFFRSQTYLNPMMRSLFASSPYKIEIQKNASTPGTVDFGKEFIDQLKDESPQLKFGIRLDKNGNWKDISLAKTCVLALERLTVKTFHNYCCILIRLIKKEDNAFSKMHKEIILQKKIADKNYMRYMKKKKQKPNEVNVFEHLIQISTPYNQQIVALYPVVGEKIKKYYSRVEEAKKDIFAVSENDLIISNQKSMAKLTQKIAENQNESKAAFQELIRTFESI